MSKHVLGLYCSERTAQAVIVERNGISNRLLDLHEWENTLFDYAGDDTPGMDEFVEQLSLFLKPHQRAEQVGVALDTSLLFFNTIPFETTASRQQIKEQLEWELQEYFPGSPHNAFASDIHTLARHQDSQYDNVLAISVRRDLIQKLHSGLRRLKLTLDIVDSDFFSADSSLRVNSPEMSNRSFVLAGVKEGRIDTSIIRNNEVESYAYYEATTDEDIVQKIKTISQSESGLHSILLFGTGLTRELITEIRKHSPTLIETLNPFRVVDIAGSVKLEKDPTPMSFRYAAAVGVALRDD